MKTNLLELIDFEKVDSLLEGFYKTTGFVTAVVDLEGNVLSKSGWREICTEFHRVHPDTASKCRVSDTELASRSFAGEIVHTYKCLNGLVDVVVPLTINGEHIASLFTGQFFFEEPDHSFFKRQAEKYGFDETKYLEALGKVPVVSKEKVKSSIDFLLNMTRLIGEMTLQKQKQTELNNELKEIEGKYRNLANTGLALVWTSGTDKLCNYFNDPWLTFTGRTLEQEMGNGWTEGVHADDFDRCMETFVTAFDKRVPFKMEYRLRHASGEYKVILDLGTPNFDSKGEFIGYIGHCFDITERKQAEEAMRQSEKQSAFLAQTAFELVELTSIQEIYRYTVKKLYELFEGTSIVALVEYNHDENRWKMQQIAGVGKKAADLSRLLGFDINHMEGEISTKYFEPITSGKLEEIVFDLPGLFNNKLSATVGSTIKRMLSLEKMYCIAFQKNEKIIGNITFITNKKTEPINTRLIEAFVQQISTFVKKQKAEDALKESQEMMRNSQSVAHICSYSTNLNNDELEKSSWVCSPEFYKIFGIDKTYPHTIAGWAKFIHPDYCEEIVAYHQHVIKRGISFNREYKIIRINDAAERWVHGTGELEFDEKGNPVRMHGAIQDITERKQAEEALKSREHLLNKVFEILPIGLWFADKDGKLIRGNPAGVKIWGAEPTVSMEEYGVFKARHLLTGKEIEPDDWALARTIREGVTIVDEQLEIDTFDGQKKIILNHTAPVLDDQGNVLGAIVVNQDITERKRAEEALHESEEKYRRIAENVTDVVWITDIEMNVTYISPSVERVYGVTPEDFLKLPLTRTYPPASLEKFQKTLAEEFVKEQNPEVDKNRIFQLEVERYYADGTIGWDAVSAVFLRDIQNNPIAIQGVSRDITERKQAEEALRESEHKFKELYDDAPVCYHEIDSEGRITRVNNTETALLGFTQEEMIGKHFWDFLVKDQREMSKKAIKEKIFAKEVSTGFERDIVCKSGERLTFFIRDILVLNTNGEVTGVRSTLENITERKQAEMIKQLQFNIARATITTRTLNELFEFIKNELNSIIDANNIFIALYNEETGMMYSPLYKDEKDDCREWPAENSATGYIVKKGQPLLLKREDTLKLKEEGLIEIVGTPAEAWLGAPLIVEGKILGAVVVQNYDNPNVYNQTSLEILELVAHELSIFIDRQRIEEKANKLSRAVEQSSVSVVITNREGIIEYVNPFFTELTGYSFEEVMGKNPGILQSGQHSVEFYQKLWEAILMGNDWEGEMLNRKKSGELFWEKAFISPIVNSEGAIINFVAIKEDITERKKMLEELLSAKEKAQESDNLKTAFLNNISHEIRTPLNGILGFGALLLETDPSPQSKKEMLAIVQQSSTRLMNTVTDYLDMARIVSGTMEVHKKVFSLQPFVEEVTEVTRPLCAVNQISFETDYQADEVGLTIDSDPELIRKIFNILLDNALKFTSRGSIGCGYKLKDGFVEFFVKDTGKGIAPEMLNAIFNTFTQEDSSDTRGYEGSGLGLSIASGLVKLLGGTIWVTSEKNRGSTFTFSIPCSTIEHVEKEPTDGEKNSTVTGKPLVLYAEDEESNYLYMEAVLRLAKCDCLHAKNGEEAVAFCKQRPEISLVLMDIKMPVMNGLEATRLIREFRPELPIIATTAYAQTGDENRFLDAGCDGYLVKPIRKEKLLALLKKYSA